MNKLENISISWESTGYSVLKNLNSTVLGIFCEFIDDKPVVMEWYNQNTDSHGITAYDDQPIFNVTGSYWSNDGGSGTVYEFVRYMENDMYYDVDMNDAYLLWGHCENDEEFDSEQLPDLAF